MKKILVLCTGNSCRSQIAEGYLRRFAAGRALVYSAGVETHGVNPKAVSVMQEDGVDISHHTSNHLSEYADLSFDYVITVCDNARERCPVFQHTAEQTHVNFPDPAKATGSAADIRQQFVAVRDEIKAFCREFIDARF